MAAALSASLPAAAYNGQGAASYADSWALGRNANYPSFGADCTNFVSQAMHQGGGYSYIGRNGSTTDDTLWWVSWNSVLGFRWSRSWSVAQNNFNFLYSTYPGGWGQGTAPGSASYYWTPAAVVTGDLLYYDWQSDGWLDHVAMQVGWGTDPTSRWSGNYVDQHSNDRLHAFWSLRPYNSQWASTTIRFMHIDSRNT
jgi:hypothetical protein